MTDNIKKDRKAIPSSPEAKAKKKKTLKTALTVVLAILIILIAVYFVTKSFSDSITGNGEFIEQIAEVYPTYTPFPAEWDINLEQDQEYLSLNTNIMYGQGDSGSLYSLEDFYSGSMHEGQKFFSEYFNILRSGDYEKYPDLFTKQYKDTPPEKRFEKNVERQFPPQRVYDITVRELGRTEDAGKNVIYGIYYVDYKINRNSNLFRNDIGRNSELGIETSRPLYFHLVTHNPHTEKEETYISNMYTESTMKAYAAGGASSEE